MTKRRIGVMILKKLKFRQQKLTKSGKTILFGVWTLKDIYVGQVKWEFGEYRFMPVFSCLSLGRVELDEIESFIELKMKQRSTAFAMLAK